MSFASTSEPAKSAVSGERSVGAMNHSCHRSVRPETIEMIAPLERRPRSHGNRRIGLSLAHCPEDMSLCLLDMRHFVEGRTPAQIRCYAAIIATASTNLEGTLGYIL